MQGLDHPEILTAMATGYPSWNQPEEFFCECCGDGLDGAMYFDEEYEHLCKSCLLRLHEHRG